MAFPVFQLGSLLINGVVDHFKGKQEIKKAKVESEIKVIQRASEHVQDWETIHAKGSQTSWKDEYWTIVLSIPAIMSFIPGLVEYVEQGFTALNAMPEWYQYMLWIAIGASFGVRIGGAIKDKLFK